MATRGQRRSFFALDISLNRGAVPPKLANVIHVPSRSTEPSVGEFRAIRSNDRVDRKPKVARSTRFTDPRAFSFPGVDSPGRESVLFERVTVVGLAFDFLSLVRREVQFDEDFCNRSSRTKGSLGTTPVIVDRNEDRIRRTRLHREIFPRIKPSPRVEGGVE